MLLHSLIGTARFPMAYNGCWNILMHYHPQCGARIANKAMLLGRGMGKNQCAIVAGFEAHGRYIQICVSRMMTFAVKENEKMANILATIGYILLLLFVLEIIIFVAVGIYAFWKDMNDL